MLLVWVEVIFITEIDGSCSYSLRCLHYILTVFLNEGVKQSKYVGILVIFIIFEIYKTPERRESNPRREIASLFQLS